MTPYERICESNRYLYDLLEQLTEQIAFLELRKQFDEANHLQQQKDGIKALIEVNLNKLEDLWKVKRSAGRHNGQIEPTLSELTIILTYQSNPDRSALAIAKKLKVQEHKVNRTITKLLNNQYLNV